MDNAAISMKTAALFVERGHLADSYLALYRWSHGPETRIVTARAAAAPRPAPSAAVGAPAMK